MMIMMMDMEQATDIYAPIADRKFIDPRVPLLQSH